MMILIAAGFTVVIIPVIVVDSWLLWSIDLPFQIIVIVIVIVISVIVVIIALTLTDIDIVIEMFGAGMLIQDRFSIYVLKLERSW